MEGGFQQATSSGDGQFTIALRQMMKEEIQMMVKKEIQLMWNKEIQLMVIRTVEQVIRPIEEYLIRKVVKEEIQSAQEKFLITRNRSVENEATMSKERSLCLKFQDEVSLPVLTGKEIKGKGGAPIHVALVDKITDQVVDCGPESSSKVEILVLEVKDDDNEDNWSREDFNNRIIRKGDKKKPHFAKSNSIYLEKGIGTLDNTKLGHDSTWMKSCKCRLGARMENFGGIEVQEAWTESFMVSDSRSKLYEKHYPPSLSDQVWRLDNIGKDGAPCQRLNEKKILNVQDFLFLLNIDPQALQKIVGLGPKNWNATINHAQTCEIDDKRMFVYYPLSESKRGVVFDVVGRLEGAIHDSHYVRKSNLSEAEQDCARKLLLSTFEYRNNTIPPDNENVFGNQNNIITFDGENALLQQFAHRPSYVSSPTNLVISEGLHDHDFSSERIRGYDHTEPGTSSQIVQSCNISSGHPNNVFFSSGNMGQLYDPGSGVPNQSPSYLFRYMDHPLETFCDYNNLRSLLSPERNNNSENFGDYNSLRSLLSPERNNNPEILMARVREARSEPFVVSVKRNCGKDIHPSESRSFQGVSVCGALKMSQKRQQQEEATSLDDKRPRKSTSFKSVVLDVMHLCKLQNLTEPVLEPLIYRVVKEEVEIALRKYLISVKRNCGKDIHPSESRSLQLQFLNAISLPVFTGTCIEGEGYTNMEVALVDKLTGQVVSSGLGSSAKVEIVVLEGDFDGDEREDWTLEEFRNNMVREREGKKSLLNGDVITTLKDGIGVVGNVMFTDNSSWTRSRKFRLGARVLDNIGDDRVREARSEPFVVRDHRGELYKKHHPPSLSDEVWRLEKIGKDGAFHKRLRKERVITVQDFLRLFFLHPTRLRNILGTGMSAKMWEVAVEHARTCVLDQKLYLYSAPQKNTVVFNVVGQVIGILSNSQYILTDKLSEEEKADAHELVISAFADSDKIVTLDDESSLNMPSSSNASIVQSSSSLPSEGTYPEDSSFHKIDRSTFLPPDISSPDYMQSVYSVGGLSTFGDCLPSIDPLTYTGQVSDSIDPLTYTGQVSDSLNEHLQYFDMVCSPCIPCTPVPIIKAQKAWNILVSVLRWWFSIKRMMARKTRVREIPRYDSKDVS